MRDHREYSSYGYPVDRAQEPLSIMEMIDPQFIRQPLRHPSSSTTIGDVFPKLEEFTFLLDWN